ncbi:Transcriptional regulator, ArsR family [Acinetobacter gerneri DSM 14967 = CIP 107464 = MTCC 9824]|nr:Transcriptional regulator, ArsR family [Acinetobacter gerneri DSM 14967 = CIP 107464 = MTCC 9824]
MHKKEYQYCRLNHFFKTSVVIINLAVFGGFMKNTLEIDAMRESAASVVNIIKSLANTDRLVILCHLAHEELNVSQIEDKTQILQPTLSQQLMMLRKSDVVQTRRDGKQIFYSIKDEKLTIVLNTLYTLYCPNDK